MSRIRSFAIAVLALTLLATLPALGAEEHHALVQVWVDSPASADFIKANQAQLDIVYSKPGYFVHVAAQSKDLEFLQNSGLRLDILQRDMEVHYASKNRDPDFGVYHTLSENIAFQDSLRQLYPHVVSEKWSIGQSIEGRDLWAFRVSANPDVDEDEPEIFIDGMHHCREIMASEFCIMFAEYLAQNYGVDPEITWLLDHREVYILPIVNPDGLAYNELTDPNGGGMWRKNRRNNGDGTYGVDPNRNYPYEWGYDNIGSSPYTDDPTYRGPSPASEPEVQAMISFINSRQFRTHNTVHCYGNLTLYPWGYVPTPTPDSDIFIHMGDEMVKYNGYVPGQPADAIHYDVNGGTIDWAYGATDEHDLIYSFSNEIGNGGDGFWPEQHRRGPLFQENIWPNIYLIRVAGAFVDVHSPVVTGPAKSIEPGQAGTLNLTVENQSVYASALNVSLTLRSDDPWVQFEDAERIVGDLAIMTETDLSADPIPFSVDAACPDGHLVNFSVTVAMEDGDLTYDLAFMVGSPNVIFADNMESGSGNWTRTGDWGLTGNHFHSPFSSLTDSPSGNYDDYGSSSATLTDSYPATGLSFWHRYDIEEGYDYGRVQVSADGGPWSTVRSFDGFQNAFEQVDVDLSEFAGSELQIRFMLETDSWVTEDGWYIDDVTLIGAGTDNVAPDTPIALSPGPGELTFPWLDLTVANSVDPEGAPVVYGFRIYADELCTDLVAAVDDLPEGENGETSWYVTGLLEMETNYWWRAYAGDGEVRSALSEPIGWTTTNYTPVGDLVITAPQLQILGNVSGNGARLQLSLPGNTDVKLDIYDARGARVRRLHSGVLEGGTRTLVWDGRDSYGRSAASGVYFVRVQAGQKALTGRVVLVR